MLEENWRVGVGIASVGLEDGQRRGQGNRLSIGRGAVVVDDRGRYWDFEVGLSHIENHTPMRGKQGQELQFHRTDLYYRARYLFTPDRLFIGSRAALSRLTQRPQGASSNRDLEITLGVVGGWMPWHNFVLEVESSAASPSVSSSGLEYATQEYLLRMEIRFD
ncbi:hypothetical protein CKO15_02590 [Halorhodospira abdelmalekii]|nr:hypothetical protein [Halorhodospira abdelmalekii]